MQSTKPLVEKILNSPKLASGVKRGLVLLWWADMVGQDLAKITQAERLEDKVLYVKAHDSVIAHQLTYMRSRFLAKLADRFPNMVLDIRFHVGQLEAKAPVLSAFERNLSKPQFLHAKELLSKLDPSPLDQVLLKAACAFVVMQDQLPNNYCAVCGVKSQHQPCKPCSYTLQHPAVRLDAKRLLRRPLSSRLEAYPKLCAIFLAHSELQQQMDVLAMQVIKVSDAEQAQLLDMLRDVAKRYLMVRYQTTNPQQQLQQLPSAVRTLVRDIE